MSHDTKDSGPQASSPRARAVADQRALIASELEATMVVEAAAGTGKTTELVRRIVRIIESDGASIDGVVAVTFSEKAAGELKLRLREELERARARHASDSVESRRLAKAVYDFEEAHVSTIHGFCAELLRERPVEAGVDPAFAVLTETQAELLFDEAFIAWLHQALAEPGEGVRRSLRRPVGWSPDDDESGPVERLRRAARDLREWRDHEAAWKRPEYHRDASIDELIEQLAAFAAMTAQPLKKGDIFSADTAPARRAMAEIDRLRRIGARDSDGWEADLIRLAEHREFARPRKGSGVAFAAGVPRQAAHDAHAALLRALASFRSLANADLAALLREELRDCLAKYEARKLAAGALDFLDLLIKARDLVQRSSSVRESFRARFKVLLVDEFQDTDPLQSELLLELASAPGDTIRSGALFIVGDPKQSIYRFRRADVGAYARISEHMRAQGARRVTLATSFRAVPQIQRFVNAAFGDEMTGDRESLQADYVPLRPHRADHADQPAVVALPVPRPYGVRDVTLQALETSQPPTIGEFVRWLVSPECPWTIETHPGEATPSHGEATPSLGSPAPPPRRRIVPSDICLLFRRFLKFGEDVTRDYVEALEARGVPHLLVGGKTFHEREEVDAIRTALTAIEWPEDELSVYATLRGPLFAIGEEELLEYHAGARMFHPYRVPKDLPERLAPAGTALGLLRELHASRNYRSVADTIGRLVSATRAHAGFILWRGGEQVLANVLHISDLARRYEAEGGLSFRGFVDLLREAASKAEAPEAPILEEGSEGVRLMTVHKAKGLEFPVVILADIGCRLSQEEASRHLDSAKGLCALRIGGWTPLDLLEHNDLEARRDEAEGVRLAYVAATRARDLLVVPAVGDRPFQKGWVRPLNRALYPPVDRRQHPAPAKGCPPFSGKDTVLERPDGMQADAATVRPGAYELADPGSGEPYTVVWWDPRALDRPADDPRGLRREELIAKDAAAEDVRADRARYDQWRQRRAEVQAAGAQPSVTVLTASEFAHASSPATVTDLASIVIADAGAKPDRPSGRRFGILVHALLAAVPLDATAAAIRDLADVQARLLGATDDERAEAAAIADRVLRHPIVAAAREARAAGRDVRREAPVSIVISRPEYPAGEAASSSAAGHQRGPQGPPVPARPAFARSKSAELRRGKPVPPDLPALVDGQIDLVYDEGAGWVIVDFKTDAEIAGAEPIYRRQVALYVDAMARATGRSARGILFRV